MASGKTCVGRELASLEGLPFIDLDQRIEEHAGEAIASMLARDGEAAFREIESTVLSQVIEQASHQPSVVATGGGTPTISANLKSMREAGLVVELGAQFETVARRASQDGGASKRPLLAGDRATILDLFGSRQTFYRQAHATVSVEGRTPLEIASRVASLRTLARSSPRPRSICALSDRAYPIIISAGVLDGVGALLAKRKPDASKVAIVTDDNVGPLYLNRVRASLETAGFAVRSISVAPGEASKSPQKHAELAEALVGSGLDRSSVVVALGGGVVGDLAGFVASSLFRGVPIVQVPTTLLAMTDSAIGGKTGVNLASGKNLLGAFWQPLLVVADPEVLSTLPERELRAGFGELYKYGLLDGERLYSLIDAYTSTAGVAERSATSLAEETIARCAGYKSAIVTRDEREITGERAQLNLGHTIGHAIEKAAGYGTLLHGEAVALGLIASARVSQALGLCGSELESRITRSLEGAGLDVALDDWMRPDVLSAVGVDKKRTGKRIRFIALRGVGVPEIAEIDTDEITKILLPTAQA